MVALAVTWEQLAKENIHAAQTLIAAGLQRACVTRCYYALYAGIASTAISRGMTSFAHSWNNPSHGAAPELARNNLGLASAEGEMVAWLCSLLRVMREDADYRPSQNIDDELARVALREASAGLTLLNIAL